MDEQLADTINIEESQVTSDYKSNTSWEKMEEEIIRIIDRKNKEISDVCEKEFKDGPGMCSRTVCNKKHD